MTNLPLTINDLLFTINDLLSDVTQWTGALGVPACNERDSAKKRCDSLQLEYNGARFRVEATLMASEDACAPVVFLIS